MKVQRLLLPLALGAGVLSLLACGGEGEPADSRAAAPPEPPAATASAPARPDESGHEGHGNMASDAAPMHEESAPANAWSELTAVRDEITAVVEAGRLSEVHAKSERLPAIADVLMAGARDLPAEKRTRAEATLRQLPAVAKTLHEAADAGDAAATSRELKRLDGIIALLETQLPADLRESAAAPASEHGGHGAAANATPGHDHAAHQHAAGPIALVEEAPKATLRVLSSEFKFEPASLTLAAGVATRIELENHGAVDHALIVAAPDGKGDLIHLHALAHATDAGTYRIDQPGRYEILCTIAGHTEAGMVGELIVQ